MDISEIVPILAAFAVALVAGAALRPVRRIFSRGLRRTLAALMSVLALAGLLVAGASLFFDLHYTRHRMPLPSPDRRRLAITSFTVDNGTGTDQVEVAIRRTWSPYAHRVFAGTTHFQADAATPEPSLRWVDDTHLEIAFHTFVAEGTAVENTTPAPECAIVADGVTITCIENRVHVAK